MSRNICATRCIGCSNELTMDNLQLTSEEALRCKVYILTINKRLAGIAYFLSLIAEFSSLNSECYKQKGIRLKVKYTSALFVYFSKTR